MQKIPLQQTPGLFFIMEYADGIGWCPLCQQPQTANGSNLHRTENIESLGRISPHFL